jgi:hypothetical protein
LDPAQPKTPVDRWVTHVAHAGLMLLGAAVLALGLGFHVMSGQATALASSGRLAHLEVQNDGLVAALSGLNTDLDQLTEGFVHSRNVAMEARGLIGLDPSLVRIEIASERDPSQATDWGNIYAVVLARSGMRLDRTIKQARELRVTYDEIVARMEREAEAWGCIPSTRPLEESRVTSTFGRRRDPFTGRLAWHRGIDLRAPYGTPVLASAEGRVIRAGYYGAYGRLVEMDHGNGLRTRYAHNSRLAVKVGQWMRRGEVLAYVGSTGRASASHLHFEVHLDGEPVNPEPYILPDLIAAD